MQKEFSSAFFVRLICDFGEWMQLFFSLVGKSDVMSIGVLSGRAVSNSSLYKGRHEQYHVVMFLFYSHTHSEKGKEASIKNDMQCGTLKEVLKMAGHYYLLFQSSVFWTFFLALSFSSFDAGSFSIINEYFHQNVVWNKLRILRDTLIIKAYMISLLYASKVCHEKADLFIS